MIQRYRSNGFISKFIIILFQVITVSCINMCENGTTTGIIVPFERQDNEITNCHCSVKAASTTKIVFNTHINRPTGCELNLVVAVKSTTQYYSCYNNEQIFLDISPGEEIKLGLEHRKGRTATGGLEFDFMITSQPIGSAFTISCYAIPDPPGSTGATLQADTSIEQSTRSTPTTEQQTSTPHTSLNTQSSSESPNTSVRSATPPSSFSDIVPGIVGGVVGAIVVIVVFVVIALCILKRREKADEARQANWVLY